MANFVTTDLRQSQVIQYTTPVTGATINVNTTQIITGLTMTGGTVIGALTTLAVGSFATYMFHATSAEWWRVS
jgi:cytosine/uracil/thiamine/allantoin permease